ncbi:hypothetical protein QJQ45_015286 [Haematococcus lacustris]|nr:hypothetical protein QJQ45_015286 [Haematococcus lacustris]
MLARNSLCVRCLSRPRDPIASARQRLGVSRALASAVAMVPPPSVTVLDDIVKSPHDLKCCRYVKLANGLTCLLISDPQMLTPTTEGAAQEDEESEEAEGDGDESSEGDDGEEEDEDEDDDDDDDDDKEEEEEEEGVKARGRRGAAGHKAVKKAAAAMAVGVGSLSDPAELQASHASGLQGTGEGQYHLVRPGCCCCCRYSSKYPDENEYDDFLTKHGGSSNAFTELVRVWRGEVLAVDSEFAGVQQSDACRASQLMCHTARAGHPYRQFSWGNKRSLWDQPRAAGINVRQAVLDYYHHPQAWPAACCLLPVAAATHYSAERMSLVLLGGEGLDTLQGRRLYLMPAVKDTHEVSLTFALPCLHPHYGAKAEAYLGHLARGLGPLRYVEHLLPGSPTRRKLAVHILPGKDCPASGVAAAQPALGTDSADAVNIPDLAAFKATCDRLPVRRGTLPPLAA